MKIGLENKRTAIVAAVLVIFATWYGIYQLGSSESSTPASATPGVAQRSRIVPRSQQKSTTQVNTPSLDPRLKLDLLRASERISYSGSGRNIFKDTEEPIPHPVRDVRTPPPAPPPAPVAQGPPPIRLKFFGFANRPGEAKQVFLADGDDVFIARQGDVVDRQYKVVEIRSSEVVIQDILNNNTQRIPLTAG